MIFRESAAKNRPVIVDEIVTVQVTCYSSHRTRRGIGPNVRREIFVVDVDSLIDDSDYNTTAPGGRVPCRGGADFCQTKLLCEPRVVWSYRRLQNVVGLGVEDVRLIPERNDCLQRITMRNANAPQSF